MSRSSPDLYATRSGVSVPADPPTYEDLWYRITEAAGDRPPFDPVLLSIVSVA